MSSFEDSMKSKPVSSGKHDPAATDLDYYSKPENYTGASLQAFQRFQADKTKEEKAQQRTEKKRVIKDAKYYFFNRYKHILKDVIFIDDLLEREKDESSEEELEEEETTASRKSPAVESLKPIAEDEEGDEDYRAISADSEAKRRASTSPEKSSAYPGSSAAEDRLTPDSGHLTPLGGRKRTSFVAISSASLRQSTVVQRLYMDKMAKEIRAKQLKDIFVRCVRGIKAICRLSASARGKQAAQTTGMRTFMDIATDDTSTEENRKNAGLSFDPSYYKAKKEISLSSETKTILTTASELRTPDMVQTAMFGLQCLRSYAEYPLHMQEKLAKVAWYEVVAPKRIIIRQGHFAENFYFILSGHAVVTILLKDPKTGASFVKTATVMKRGMSFGELALLHHSKRTATVTSQDTVHLLSIGREDFFDIFMSGSEGDMPEHIKFISNLDFMRDWPIEQLVEHPEHCLLHFFKRNTSIVPNSNKSEWMYIIKSIFHGNLVNLVSVKYAALGPGEPYLPLGYMEDTNHHTDSPENTGQGSCVVLKKLKGVTANSHTAKPKIKDGELLPPKMKAIVFTPKVHTGLRKRKKSGKETKKTEEEAGQGEHMAFSKQNYPKTRKAHFSSKSGLEKRMCYTPPRRCLPKKQNTLPEPVTQSKHGPVFVQVSIMKPRDVFGLDSIQFEDDIKRVHTSVSLVSRGAECIMLSKDFYAKHANDKVKKRVRESVRAYPDEEVFQDNLQIKEDWMMYKKVVLNDVTSAIRGHSNRFGS